MSKEIGRRLQRLEQRLERTRKAEQYPAWRVYASLEDALKDTTFRGKQYIGFSPDDWDTYPNETPATVAIVD